MTKKQILTILAPILSIALIAFILYKTKTPHTHGEHSHTHDEEVYTDEEKNKLNEIIKNAGQEKN